VILEATAMPELPGFSLPVAPILLALAGVGAFWAFRVRRRGDPGLRMYRRACRLVRRRGWEIPPSLPPAAAAEWLVAQAGPAAEPMRALAWALYRYRYGEQPRP
jgi:hypothetical protein